jgi:hypothetical protein
MANYVPSVEQLVVEIFVTSASVQRHPDVTTAIFPASQSAASTTTPF